MKPLLPLAALCLACLACLSSCAAPPQVIEKPGEPVLYEWNDDGGPGEVAIRINLTAQRAFYTRGGRPIGWSFVATGKDGHRTPAGSYTITEMVVDKYSNRYGWIEDEFGNVVDNDAKSSDRVPPGCRYVPAPMPFWMRLTNYGIGMHAGIIPEPGLPASHGCIRLPKPLAPLLYSQVRLGTRVKIHHGSGENYPADPAGPGSGMPDPLVQVNQSLGSF